MSTRLPQKNRWMSYLSDNILLDVEEPPASGQYFWCNQQGTEHADISGEVGASKAEGVGDMQTLTCDAKKRMREDVGKETTGNKAAREKQRRDRLNDRFVELCHMLEPERPAKTDKAAILSDAVKAISTLRTETETLKETNSQLREQIQELKGEKSELREEKIRLKVEKEKLEQQLKGVTLPPGYMPPLFGSASCSGSIRSAGTGSSSQLGMQAPGTHPHLPQPRHLALAAPLERAGGGASEILTGGLSCARSLETPRLVLIHSRC